MAARSAAAALALLLLACTGEAAGPAPSPPATPPAPARSPAAPSPDPSPVSFDEEAALAHVRVLAEEIGPREATTPAYRAAAAFVELELSRAGLLVSRQVFAVPAGDQDGAPVPAGESLNVIAVAPGFDALAPHVVIGAHLDTTVDSPGANDNASGVAVMLELARMSAREPPGIPAAFVAFGAEERRRRPGGITYGSAAWLDALDARRRAAIVAMVSIDMVGAGPRVLVCAGDPSSAPASSLLAAGRRAGVPAASCARDTLSDHRPFQEAGIPAAHLWSGDHPSIHSPRDVVGVVTADALARAGRLAWEWLRSLEGPGL